MGQRLLNRSLWMGSGLRGLIPYGILGFRKENREMDNLLLLTPSGLKIPTRLLECNNKYGDYSYVVTTIVFTDR